MSVVARLSIFLLVALALSSAAPRGLSQSFNAFGSGCADWVYASTVWNGDLIVGGKFTSAGGVAASHIARWDGTSWSALGSGLNGDVWALTVYQGLLIAAGDFVDAGSVNVNFIAAWDGTSWTDLEGGTNSSVRSLCVWNSKLIAGGYFTSADGAANHIASWDGSNWAPLGAGTGGSQGQVMAVSTYGPDLVAAGFFTTAGGAPAQRIAKWNGVAWSPLGSGIGNIPYALVEYRGKLLVGGLFLSAGGIAAADVASWNGTSWSALGSGIGGGVYGYVLTLAVYNDNLYAGGIYTTAGGQPAANLARWNGSAWSPIATYMGSGGTVQAVYTMTPYGNDLAFGGIFYSVSGYGGVSNCGNVAAYNEFFSTYGGGCAGTGGLAPELAGVGIPAASALTGVAVTNGLPFGAGAVFVGSDSASTVYYGCTGLVGGTILPAFNVALDGTGSTTLTTTMPPWVPTGTTVYCQFAGFDAGAPNGIFSTSNGLKITFQ